MSDERFVRVEDMKRALQDVIDAEFKPLVAAKDAEIARLRLALTQPPERGEYRRGIEDAANVLREAITNLRREPVMQREETMAWILEGMETKIRSLSSSGLTCRICRQPESRHAEAWCKGNPGRECPPREPLPGPVETCGAVPPGVYVGWPCALARGHAGPHNDAPGSEAQPPSPDYVRGQERMRERAAIRVAEMLAAIEFVNLINGWTNEIRSLPLEDAGEGAATCVVPNCHAGMLVRAGRETISCPVCDGTITAEEAKSLARNHVAPAPSPSPAPNPSPWKMKCSHGIDTLVTCPSCIHEMTEQLRPSPAPAGEGRFESVWCALHGRMELDPDSDSYWCPECRKATPPPDAGHNEGEG